jgi:hypothetical protein
VYHYYIFVACLCDTQDNGSNAVEGDTEDGSSVTNRQQICSNDTQGTNATATVDEPGNNDTHIADEQGTNDTPMVDEPGIIACLLLSNHLLYLRRLH